MKLNLPKTVKVDNEHWAKMVWLQSDKVTLEYKHGLKDVSRDRVHIPAQHMGTIHLPTEEDYSRGIEVIWAESYKEAREFFDEHIYAQRPNGPYDCTGQWFTIRATWKEVNVPNVYLVDHQMGCDV